MYTFKINWIVVESGHRVTLSSLTYYLCMYVYSPEGFERTPLKPARPEYHTDCARARQCSSVSFVLYVYLAFVCACAHNERTTTTADSADMITGRTHADATARPGSLVGRKNAAPHQHIGTTMRI